MSISYQDGIAPASNTTGQCTLNSACSIGDLICAFGVYEGVGSALTGLTVSDNVNSGNYNNIRSYYFAGGTTQYLISWIQCNASGTPTLTFSQASSASDIYVAVMRWNGFVGTIHADPNFSDNTNLYSAAIDSGGFAAASNNELAVAWETNGTSAPVNPTPWTTRVQTPYVFVGGLDNIGVSLGANIEYQQTLTGNARWYAFVTGFYGSAATPPSSMFLTFP